MEGSKLLTVTKEYTWDMAHMLANHKGLCANLHGHTYKMLVTLACKNENIDTDEATEGMVIDFKTLKEIVKTHIVDELDHATMINVYSPSALEDDLLRVLMKHYSKIKKVNYRPTAENMAKDFFKRIQEQLESRVPNVGLVAVRVYETPTSYAECRI